MLRHGFATMLLAFLCLLAVPGYAQIPDTLSNFAFGTLKAVTPTTFTLSASDYSDPTANTEVEFIRSSSTETDGCTFDQVALGVETFVRFEQTAQGLEAQSVHFRSCTPVYTFVGIVNDRQGNLITMSQFDGSEPIQLTATDQTIITSCLGTQVSLEYVTEGSQIVASVADDNGTYVADAISIQSNCPTWMYSKASFVSFADGVLTVTLEDGQTVQLESMKRDPLIDIDTLNNENGVFTCTGQFVAWSEIAVGTLMSVNWLDFAAPEVDRYSYVTILDGCPQEFSGEIVAVNGTSIVVRDYAGNESEFDITPETSIYGCSYGREGQAQLRVGNIVNLAFIDRDGRPTALYVNVQNDCSENGYIIGEIVAIGSDYIEVVLADTMGQVLGAKRFAISDETVFLTCLGTFGTLADFKVGDIVFIIGGDLQNDAYVTFFVQSQSDCEQYRFSGTIVSATATEIVVDTDGGVRTLLVDANSVFYNCLGNVVELSGELVGSKISGTVTSDKVTIGDAWLEAGCPQSALVGGSVIAADDNSFTVASEADGSSVVFARHDMTTVVDKNGEMLDWNAITVGSLVCTYGIEENDALHAVTVLVGTTCNRVDTLTADLRMNGQIVSVDGEKVTVSRGSVTMPFHLTNSTTVTMVNQGVASPSMLREGMSVIVSSDRRVNGAEPVAKSIVVTGNGTTSVDNTTTPNGALAVSPNPASSMVRITLNGVAPEGSVSVVDMTGTIVLSASNNTTLNVADLTPGAYRVVALDAQGNRISAPLNIVR
jgi:hypothetical protein